MNYFTRFISNFLTDQVICNRCHCDTPRAKAIEDCGYDDWGYQCVACATDSGLLKRVSEQEKAQVERLERRKEFGL